MASTHKASDIGRTVGMFLLHGTFALLGPALVDSLVHRVVRVSSASDIIIRVWAVSVLCAFFTALFMTPALRSKTALWVWVVPTLWFGLGLIARENSIPQGVFRETLFTHFSGAACANALDPRACRDFFLFSLTLIRAASYSAGALVSLFFYRRRQNPQETLTVEDVSA